MIVPIIIPYYKNHAQLQRCLAHLYAQTWPVEIFVRDNSQDNIYFTAAVNEGIRRYLDKQEVTYIVILNQDMYLESHAIEEMVKFMDDHPQCGVGTPLQLHSHYPHYVVCAGGQEAFPFGRHLHGPIETFSQSIELAWSNGACMILRKVMIQEIGVLDKNFIFIGSDSDYCFTARSRGWQIWSIVKAKGVHEMGQSRISDDPVVGKLKLKDMIFFAEKWLTGGLYKSLAYEGQELSDEIVQEIIQSLHHALKMKEQP